MTAFACSPPPLDSLPDEVIGPGWYDSSLDLLRGLDVHEGLPADASLGEWFEHCLRA
jgi:hypothetical protein